MLRYIAQTTSSVILFGIIFFSGIAFNISAQTTNTIPTDLFLTDDGFLFWYRPSGERVVNISKIKEAEKSPESLPANHNADGHWGEKTNGLQLSLRFPKYIFTNGESVVAIMLMRNITNKPQTYFRPPRILASQNGKVLKTKNDNGLHLMQVTMLPQTTLFPQTQNRFQIILNKVYDLSENGEYIFQAACHNPEVNSQKVSVIIKK
ncbi:MAG TPA: hypothetical protein VFM25_08355 [Verrucomicrobiae bacterium]|nr:hypothetical protein [Verrucomicrobiae bacterium]